MSNSSHRNIQFVRLGDYVVSQKGKKPKLLSKEKTKSASVPYVNIKAFETNVYDEYTNGEGCVLCENGDFLMVWDGSRSGFVGKAVQGALGSTLVKLTFPDVEQDFAYYFLQSKYQEINTRARGVGIPHVDPNLLWNYNFPLPPLPEQRRIVAKIEELFSELDKGVEQLKQAQQQLKVYRQAVLKAAFEGKLTGEYKVDGELPEGWEWKLLKDIASLIGGVTKGRKLDGKKIISLPYLRVANVQDGYLDLTEIKSIEVLDTDLGKYRLQKGDILYNEGGDKDKLGRGSIWNNEIENCIHQNHVYRARVNLKHFSPKFISLYSQTKIAKKYFFDNAKQTTNLASINLTKLGNLTIPIPNFTTQKQIVTAIESRLSVCAGMEERIVESLKQAEMLRQSILKRAFEGNLV